MTIRNSHIFVVFALLLYLMPATSQAFVYKDWEVACDNTNTCAALGFLSQKGEEGSGYINIERLAGPSAIPSIKIHLTPDIPLTDKKLENITFIVDGKKLFSTDATVTFNPDEEIAQPVLTLPNDKIASFLTGIRSGKTLTVTIDKNDLTTSLDGIAASLLKMDDVQARIGTTTALIRPGSNPASSVPDPAKMPVITRAKIPEGLVADQSLADKLRAELKRTRKTLDCDDIDTGNLRNSGLGGDAVYALSTTLSLVAIQCSMAAYQGNTGFWLVKDADVKNAQPVSFKPPVIKGEKVERVSSNQLTEAGFNSNDASISFLEKGRGISDCGETGTYVWTGTSFELCSYTRLQTCKGVMQWPTLWKADCGIK